ncbi:MAG: glycogen-binding domain-containing protein [Planctomycetes bacterium]|nr:glycogen-binding domain-containing protein [Planctomycetota bacterium]
MSKHQTAVAHPQADQHTMTLKDSDAKLVTITGSFCHWAPEGHPLRHDGHGTWKTTLSLQPGRYEYRFIVDGEWRDDPDCAERVPNPFGTDNSVFEV